MMAITYKRNWGFPFCHCCYIISRITLIFLILEYQFQLLAAHVKRVFAALEIETIFLIKTNI